MKTRAYFFAQVNIDLPQLPGPEPRQQTIALPIADYLLGRKKVNVSPRVLPSTGFQTLAGARGPSTFVRMHEALNPA